ncbi:hypothetical protein CF319_g4110 [Tilletia indica]|nr:hypothetical protein CF319_g4110 [Tilletia indica]
MLHDDAVSKGKKDLRQVLFAAPLSAAAEELGRIPADVVAPQSTMLRVEPGMGQVEKPPLLLGVMSGYGDLKKPIVSPPYYTLFRNFNTIQEQAGTQAGGPGSLQPSGEDGGNFRRHSRSQLSDGGKHPGLPDEARRGGGLQYLEAYCLEMPLDYGPKSADKRGLVQSKHLPEQGELVCPILVAIES